MTAKMRNMFTQVIYGSGTKTSRQDIFKYMH